MKDAIDTARRRFLGVGAAVVGGGLLVGITPWLPIKAIAEGDSSNQTGDLVTIVAFDDAGQRLGKRQVQVIHKTPAQWHQKLNSAQFYILRKAGTERPFSGRYVNKPAQHGIYRCQGCGNALYDSDTQFHSGTGWPSFYQPIAAENVTEHTDRRLGMVRTEIKCTHCGGHLGHKFHDGPKPTGLRYCMDSRALKLVTTENA